jgi:hypothetical protein
MRNRAASRGSGHVEDKPFVPAGRELIFARALHFGLEGDFAVATSLLVPQVENSLRQLLANSGDMVIKYDDKGIRYSHIKR